MREHCRDSGDEIGHQKIHRNAKQTSRSDVPAQQLATFVDRDQYRTHDQRDFHRTQNSASLSSNGDKRAKIRSDRDLESVMASSTTVPPAFHATFLTH